MGGLGGLGGGPTGAGGTGGDEAGGAGGGEPGGLGGDSGAPCGAYEVTFAKKALDLAPQPQASLAAFAVATLPGDDVVLSGYIARGGNITFGKGTPNEQTILAGGHVAFWARYDKNGDFEYVRSFTGSYSEGKEVAVYPDGSFLVAGEFQTSLILDWQLPSQKTLTADDYNDMDAFVARVGTDGNVIWAVSAESAANGYTRGLAIKPNGNFVLASNGGQTTFAPETPGALVGGSTVHHLTEFTSAGVPVRDTPLGIVGSGGISDVAALGDGSVMLIGSFVNTLSFPGSPSITLTGDDLDTAYFIAHVNAAGVVDFAESVGSYSEAHDLVVAGAGEVIATGRVEATSVFDPGGPLEASFVNNSGFVAVYEPPGALLSVARTGGGSAAWGQRDAILSPQGEIISMGEFMYTRDFGGEADRTLSGGGAYVQCQDEDGRLGWVDQLVGIPAPNAGGLPRAATILSDGSIVVVGTHGRAFEVGGFAGARTPLTVGGDYSNSFLLKYSPVE